MKKFLLYGLAWLAGTFVSCQYDLDTPLEQEGGNLSLQVEIDNIGTGLQVDTRATIINPEEGEEQIKNLYLLFFNKNSEGNTTYQGYHKMEGTITTGSLIPLTYEGINTGSYSILALANITGYSLQYSRSEAALDDFLNGLNSSMSISEVIAGTTIHVGNVSSGFDDKVIAPNNIVMSGITEKAEGQQVINLKLTRGVTRFDVRNLDINYHLTSVSIWNNASSTPLWLSGEQSSDRSAINKGRFYGVATETGKEEIKGGLYAFENYNADPSKGDKETTCLIIGLKPEAGDTTYYRVNIHPEESGQSLKRNFVYQLTIRTVFDSGEPSEMEAYQSQADPNIDVDINNWNLDDEGLILTDGKNVMAIPSKVIRFVQEGGTRKFSIFVQGEGTLAMTQNLPSGFTASLSGNELTVTAAPLGDLKIREGTLDLSFAGLTGTVQVLQEPKENHFLRIDKTLLTGFPATANSVHVGTSININSSKDWTARIYNTGESRFSFDQDDGTALETEGISGANLEMFVARDNTSNKVLTAFVLIALKNEPGYSRVVMLKQAASSGITIDLGSVTSLDFQANGVPKYISNSFPGDAYEILVDPGTDMNGNFNDWGAVLTGEEENVKLFELKIEKNLSSDGINRVVVYPKGSAEYPYYNMTDKELNNVKLKVYWGSNESEDDPDKYKEVPITQDALIFKVNNVFIDPKGGVFDMQIDIPDGFSWKVEITGNWETKEKFANMEHKGYIIDNSGNKLTSGEISGQTSKVLKVGFDKMLFPIVNTSPVLTLKFTLEQIPGITATPVVAQTALKPRKVNILDITGGDNSWGSLKANGSKYMTPTINYYNSETMFNTKGTKCYADFEKRPSDVLDEFAASSSSPIDPLKNYNYLHAGYDKTNWSDQGFNVVNEWRKNTDGVLVIFQDYSNRHDKAVPFFTKLYNNIGYKETSETGSSKIDFTALNDNRIIKYLYKDGPFGTSDVNKFSGDLDRLNDAHSAISRETVEKTGTAIIHEYNNSNNIVVFIDPDNRIVYIGESELFSGTTTFGESYLNNSNYPRRYEANKFYANFLSYIIRAAQYGSHFTDHFKKDSDTYYPFDKLTKDPMFAD